MTGGLLKRAAFWGLALAFAVTAGGCAKSPDSVGRIGDMAADEFYGRFMYREKPSASAPYSYLNSARLAATPDAGGYYFYQIRLFLLEDRRYALNYREFDESSAGEPYHSEMYTGEWSVKGQDLILQGWGRATFVNENDYTSLQVQSESDFNGAGLNQKWIPLRYSASRDSLEKVKGESTASALEERPAGAGLPSVSAANSFLE